MTRDVAIDPVKLALAHAKRLDIKITEDSIRAIQQLSLCAIDELPDYQWCSCLRKTNETRPDKVVYRPVGPGLYANARCDKCKGRGLAKKR